MRLRGYDEIGRKLQIHWCGANLGTCGKVAEDETGSVWCAEDFVLCSQVKEAGRRHQIHIVQIFLWQLWKMRGWGLIHGVYCNPGRMREGRVDSGFQRCFDQSEQSYKGREERSRSLGFCLCNYIVSDFIQCVVKFRKKRVWGQDGNDGAWC